MSHPQGNVTMWINWKSVYDRLTIVHIAETFCGLEPIGVATTDLKQAIGKNCNIIS